MKPANIMLFGMMLASLSSAQVGAADTADADVPPPQTQIHTPSVDDISDSGSGLLLLEEEKKEEE